MGFFKVATFNCNSVRARLPAVLSWLAQEVPDVLCLQETKVQDKDFPLSDFEGVGYQAAFTGQKSYNGVAILSKHPMADVRRRLYEAEGEEARFIRAVVQGVPVINVYVPQGYAVGSEKFLYKLRWLRDLLDDIKTKCDPSLPLLVAGDFNVALEPIDVHDPEGLKGEVCFHPDEQAVLREYLAWGLGDVLRRHHPEGGHYTFWDYRVPNALKRKIGWRIDYILATAPLIEKCTHVWIDTGARTGEKPSDHTYLVVEFDL
jgi:exodeoxyribonuclease-3